MHKCNVGNGMGFPYFNTKLLFWIRASIHITVAAGVDLGIFVKGGGTSEILPTSRSGVTSARKIWATKCMVKDPEHDDYFLQHGLGGSDITMHEWRGANHAFRKMASL